MKDYFETPHLIALANIMSAAIDSDQLDMTGDIAARDMFRLMTNELESRGIVLSDHVVCPENL